MAKHVTATTSDLIAMTSPVLNTEGAAALLCITAKSPRRSLVRLARMGAIDRPVVILGRTLWTRGSLMAFLERSHQAQLGRPMPASRIVIEIKQQGDQTSKLT